MTVSNAIPPRLTSLSPQGGCGCKLAPEVVYAIAGRFGRRAGAGRAATLVGTETFDDAGVVSLDDGRALVHTVDFFTPIVDDPHDYGAIAAAHALSDVYAMGARPISAVCLLGFPVHELGEELALRILGGAHATARRAGVPIVGGHSIDDPRPTFGLAVTGLVDADALVRNCGGRPGDVLVLTKPVGAGVICTAAKHERVATSVLGAATEAMVTLNDRARDQARDAGVRAMTDVSGFGLLGHAHELAAASGCAALIRADAVPALPGSLALLDAGARTGGGQRNQAYLEDLVAFDPRVTTSRRALLCDPMTSGGLLIAVDDRRAAQLDGWVVGELRDGATGTIRVAR